MDSPQPVTQPFPPTSVSASPIPQPAPKRKRLYEPKSWHLIILGIAGLLIIGTKTYHLAPNTQMLSPIPVVSSVQQVSPSASSSPTLTPIDNNLLVPDANGMTDRMLALRTKTSGCNYVQQGQAVLPDPTCTPGAVFDGITKEQLCAAGYSTKSVRDVSLSTKDAVYAEYGILSHARGQYEIDHLIALEDGGSNDISNLWPQPSSPTPGFHEKDILETQLHGEICSNAIDLQSAWSELKDWVHAYNAN